MDGEIPNTVVPPVQDDGPILQCQDCGEKYSLGHICRQSIDREVMQARSAFITAISALAKIRNLTMFWKRGSEVERLKEVSAVARKALEDIQELVFKPKEDDNESDNAGAGDSGDVSVSSSDSV